MAPKKGPHTPPGGTQPRNKGTERTGTPKGGTGAQQAKGSGGNTSRALHGAPIQSRTGVGGPWRWIIVGDGPVPQQGAPRDGHGNLANVNPIGAQPMLKPTPAISGGGKDAAKRLQDTIARTNSTYLKGQMSVGGTKGGTVDRSAAVKKAWETRRQNYGNSGRKDK